MTTEDSYEASSSEAINQAATQTYQMAMYNAQKEDVQASDIPEFIAYEIISLAEWYSPDAESIGLVARKILESYNISPECNKIIRQHLEVES